MKNLLNKNVLWWFLAKKVYRCPCLLHVLIQVWNQDIGRLDDIKRAVEDLHWGNESGLLYFICVNENKENVMFLCKAHLNITVMSEMRYGCTSQTHKDFYFDSVKKRFFVAALDIFVRNLLFYFLIMILV